MRFDIVTAFFLSLLLALQQVASVEFRDRDRPSPRPPDHHSRHVARAVSSSSSSSSSPLSASFLVKPSINMTLVSDSITNSTSTTTTTLTPTTSVNSTLPLPPSTPPTSPPSPTPTPLDNSLSYSLGTSCLSYLAIVASSSTFLSCLPFSLLLTSSSSYSTMINTALSTNNFTTLNSLIAYTISPEPSIAQCQSYMSGVLNDIASKGNCATDLTARNAVALLIKAGIGNYEVVRQASRLTDPQTGVYCYLEALASNRPDDLYLWNLPAGTPLPATSIPTCSMCSARLLDLLSETSANSTTLNSTLVHSAVSTVNQACGATFVSYSTGAISSSTLGQGRNSLSTSLSLLALTVGTLITGTLISH